MAMHKRYWNKITNNADPNNIWDIHKRHTLTHTRPIPIILVVATLADKFDVFREQFFNLPNTHPNQSLIDKLASTCDVSDDYTIATATDVTAALKATNLNAATGHD
jgi:hypothetical protein